MGCRQAKTVTACCARKPSADSSPGTLTTECTPCLIGKLCPVLCATRRKADECTTTYAAKIQKRFIWLANSRKLQGALHCRYRTTRRT